MVLGCLSGGVSDVPGRLLSRPVWAAHVDLGAHSPFLPPSATHSRLFCPFGIRLCDCVTASNKTACALIRSDSTPQPQYTNTLASSGFRRGVAANPNAPDAEYDGGWWDQKLDVPYGLLNCGRRWNLSISLKAIWKVLQGLGLTA